MRGELSLVARFFAISPFKHKRKPPPVRVVFCGVF